MRLAAIAIVLVLALTAEAAAKGQRATLLGIVWNGGTTEIAKLDALSLKVISRRARLAEPSWFVARSPARDRAVLTIGEAQDRLRFVDLKRMRFAGGVEIGHVRGSLWRDAQRLVLVTGGEQPRVFVVDPRTRRVVRTRVLDGSVTAVARGSAVLVALLTPRERIGAARLAIVDSDGNVRELALPGIRAGWELVDRSTYRSRQEIPGLAVDPSGRRVLVVPAVGSIADIDLDTLQVALHSTRARALAARRKTLEGWSRSATWFGPHLVAVTGFDSSMVGTSVRLTTAGLTLVDTRDWSTRTIEPRAASVAVVGDTMLVCGAVWNPERQRSEGMGLTGYGPEATVRFHLFGEASIPNAQVLGRYAYLAANNNTRYTIVDPRVGKVIARVSTRAITTLADG